MIVLFSCNSVVSCYPCHGALKAMKRIALKHLEKWKESPARRPLILTGARQVGKTWLMREFGQQAYESVAYISFDSNTGMRDRKSVV